MIESLQDHLGKRYGEAGSPEGCIADGNVGFVIIGNFFGNLSAEARTAG